MRTRYSGSGKRREKMGSKKKKKDSKKRDQKEAKRTASSGVRQESFKRRKFSEPRGWALQWDALQHRLFDRGSGPDRSAAEQPPKPKARRKFPKPRGWAAKWDGFVLSETKERQNGEE